MDVGDFLLHGCWTASMSKMSAHNIGRNDLPPAHHQLEPDIINIHLQVLVVLPAELSVRGSACWSQRTAQW